VSSIDNTGLNNLGADLYESNDAIQQTHPLAAIVALLALASGCSPNQPPRIYTVNAVRAHTNEVPPSNEVVASAVNYQPASPPPSVVKTLLQTKGCIRCDLEANLQGQT